MMDLYPNSLIHARAFLSFLIEGATDYGAGMALRVRMHKIEEGVDFGIDFCFKSLVNAYPHYLKDRILVFTGEVVDESARESASGEDPGSRSRSQSSAALMGDSASIITPEEERTLIGGLCAEGRMRMAVQAFLENQTLRAAPAMVATALWALIVTIVGSVSFFVIFSGSFDDLTPEFRDREALGIAGSNLEAGMLALVIDQGMRAGRVDLEGPGISDCDFEPALGFGTEDAVTTALELAGEAMIAVELEGGQLDFTPCSGGAPVDVGVAVSMPVAFGFAFEALSFMRQREEGQYFGFAPSAEVAEPGFVSDAFCDASNAFQALSEYAKDSLEATVASFKEDANHRARQSGLLVWLLPVLYLVALTVPTVVASIAGLHEIRDLCAMLTALPDTTKALGRDPIQMSGTLTAQSRAEVDSGGDGLFFATAVAIGIFCVGIAACSTGTFVSYRAAALTFANTAEGLGHGLEVESDCVGLAQTLSVRLLLLGGGGTFDDGTPFASYADTAAFVVSPDDVIKEQLARLDVDLGQLKGFVGRHASTDEILAKDRCEPGSGTDIHTRYACSSLIWQVEFLSDLVKTATSIDDGRLANVIHMLDVHIIPSLMEYFEGVAGEIPDDVITTFRGTSIAMLVLQLVIVVALEGLLYFLRTRLSAALSGALAFWRRLPAEGLLASQPLIDYLVNAAIVKSRTPGEAMARAANDVIIVTGFGLAIEYVNPAVAGALGYVLPEELLGRNVKMLLDEESGSRVSGQWAKLRMGESWSGTLTGVSCDESTVSCAAAILALAQGRFMLVIRNETAVLELQRKAAVVKDWNDLLLNEMLPGPFVDTEVFFAAESASVVMIGIEKFTQYSEALQPAATLATLTAVFGAYDDRLRSYNTCIRLANVGDTFVAVSGLAGESPHASHAISFALDCIDALGTVNATLETALRPRIGIDSGSLIAGWFDGVVAMGEALTGARELQQAVQPGQLFVTARTHRLAAQDDFVFRAVIGGNYAVTRRPLGTKPDGRTTANPFALTSGRSAGSDASLSGLAVLL